MSQRTEFPISDRKTSEMGDPFSLYQGDGLNRILTRLGIPENATPRSIWRIVLFLGVCWLPLAVITALEGFAVGPAVGQSFLFDIAAYTQHFLVIPLGVLAEIYIDQRNREAMRQFTETGLMREEDIASYGKYFARIQRLSRSHWVDAVCLGIAYVSVFVWLGPELRDCRPTWYMQGSAGECRLTLAGYYTGIVSIPLHNYICFRWMAKCLAWIALLRRASRFKLRIDPLHPDSTGGLGFLSTVQTSFGFLVFIYGLLVAVMTWFKITQQHTAIEQPSTWAPVVLFVVLGPACFLVPLLLFTTQLYRAKNSALLAHASFVRRFTEAFTDRWIRVAPAPSNPLAAGADVSALADLRATHDGVRRMRVIPFDLRSISELVGSAVGPMIPLLLRVIHLPKPLDSLLDFLR